MKSVASWIVVLAFGSSLGAAATEVRPQLWLPLAQDGAAKIGAADAAARISGTHRFISIGGRPGFQPLSVATRCVLSAPALAGDRGTLMLSVAPLEDLGVATSMSAFNNPATAGQEYPLLMDAPSPNAVAGSVFGWYWRSHWHPQMVVKFMKGGAGGAAADFAVTPYVPVEHLPLRQYRWYHLALTWDNPASRLLVYVNGILAGVSAGPFQAQVPGSEFYLGNPAMVFSDVRVFDRVLSREEIAASMSAVGINPEPAVQRELAELFTVLPRPAAEWRPGGAWKLYYEASFTKADEIAAWKQQGSDRPEFQLLENQATPEGWLIQTSDKIHTQTRVYFWSPQIFEGDVAVQVDFRPEQDSGLALLVAQAGGLQRDDFLTDHPPRTSGGMGTIIGSNVRNYHWEFFRKAVDVRADLGTQVLVKNPWQRPLGMVTREPIEIGQWHRLLFVQEGGRLRCAIDGRWLIDATDNPWTNTGPVFSYGRIGLRLMYQTKMRFRDLRVWTRFPAAPAPSHP